MRQANPIWTAMGGALAALIAIAALSCSSETGSSGRDGGDAASGVADLVSSEVIVGRDRGTGEGVSPARDADKPSVIPTEPNLKVAFIGDQGLNSNSKAVLSLIKTEGAAMVLHQGDFDYAYNPTAWDQQITSILGASFPYFASVGNHDTATWSAYQQKLKDRLAKVPAAKCTGDLGVKASCEYQGLFFILSGVGTMGTGHEAYITAELAKQPSRIWRLCTWHKNQHDMQAGSKGDEVGWEAYKACQAGGAIIATAHEHSYSRTKSLTGLGNKAAGHGATGPPDKLEVALAKTFVFVSGLGGQSKRDFDNSHLGDTWWATIYTGNYYLKNGVQVASFNYDYGALFVVFHVDGDPRKAKGYFKTFKGETIDTFEVLSK